MVKIAQGTCSKKEPQVPLGFYIIMAAQFFSALADNALLIAAIAILQDINAPAAYEPLLKTFFAISYVVLAAFVGAFADSMPKWRVMFISNGIKIAGCIMMFYGAHPLLAYAVVGLGAATYSPAKYGILTEYLPHRQLVLANGWIEGLTVGAIILGVVLGGQLTTQWFSDTVLSFHIPVFDSANKAAIFLIGLLYIIAALINLYVPNTGVDHKLLKKNPFFLIHEFNHCLKLLWKDKLGQISLAVTTLFWGAAATLQFIVIHWAQTVLGFKLSQASNLQGVVAVGVAVGAVLASTITLRGAVKVIPVGIAMGAALLIMNFIAHPVLAIPMLILIGGLGGFLVVPMNALLQHRGHMLMGAGHSIAVQNFNENLSILLLTALYYLMIKANFSIHTIIMLFAFFLSGIMILVRKVHLLNQQQHDHVGYLDNTRHH